MVSAKIIGQRSWKYAIVKSVAKMAFTLFYRKIHVDGRENVPDGGRLIFVANHQNALMDALSIIFFSNYQPVFLARADLFKNPLVAKVLNFLKILPVYRFRDGVENMGQNEDTFRMTSEVLASGGCIGIMPEGNHGDRKRLRILKKGVFRIAFGAEEAYDFSLSVRIVPVGIDFSNTRRLMEELTVNFGKPLSVSDYFKLYSQHPQKGINAMKDDLSSSLSDLMIDIKDESNYREDELLVETGSRMLRKSLSGSIAGKRPCSELKRIFLLSLYQYFEGNPEKADELRADAGRLNELLDKWNISADVVTGGRNPALLPLLICRGLCFPVFVAGFMVHILPYLIIGFALKKVKDPQFISSVKYVLGLILVPLNYILLFSLLLSFLTPLLAGIAVFAMPLSGIAAYGCYRMSERTQDLLYFRRICRKESNLAGLLSELNMKTGRGLQPVSEMAALKLK